MQIGGFFVLVAAHEFIYPFFGHEGALYVEEKDCGHQKYGDDEQYELQEQIWDKIVGEVYANGVLTQHGDDGVVNEVGGIAHAAYDGYELPAKYFFYGFVAQYNVVQQAYEEGKQNSIDL